MRKRFNIEVRRYGPDQTDYGSESIGQITGNFGRHEVVETVKLVLRAEQIGNFNPVFCTYKGKRTLVHSDEGDLSDPFRRTEEYTKCLYIKIPCNSNP
jgi:hypothetical protein